MTMTENRNFYNKIHLLGRATVILALVCFLAVPICLAMANHVALDYKVVIQNAVPILITFSIAGICENLSFAPVIGCGALYMACVTGNVSNMKIPAAINAMENAGCSPGSDKGDVISIIAVASSTFVTTVIVFLGMLFLAPLFEPVYNNTFLKPAFENMIPALFGALLLPYIKKFPKESIVPILLPIMAIFLVGRSFFGANQSYIMILVIIASAFYSYFLHRDKAKKEGV